MADSPIHKKLNRYQQIMERIFFWHYRDGDRDVAFERIDMERAAQELEIELPKISVILPIHFVTEVCCPFQFEQKRPKGRIGLSDHPGDLAIVLLRRL